MNQAKRQLSVGMSWEDETKRLRTSWEDKLVTCLEDLSNELMYEIFEYFAVHDLFNQFSNLNQRFECLIFHSNLPLKVRYSPPSSMQYGSSQMMIPHTDRILSFHLSDRSILMEFLPLFTANFSFYRLESLILHQIKFDEIVSFLPRLTSLPRLFSLKISLSVSIDNFNEFYRLIFRLPTLKYTKLSASQLILQNSVPFITNIQLSSIEHLIIDHPCTLRMLYDILSFTPKLRRLSSEKLIHMDQNILPNIPLRLLHLTHCVIQTPNIKFDILEMFMTNLSSQLRVLRFTPNIDVMYLNADRWERLISQHMPYLHTFQYRYSDAFYDRVEYRSHHSFITRFTSPFWMGKGWMLNIQTDVTYWPPFELIYSIQSQKRIWYNERCKYIDVSKAMAQLTIRGCHFQRCDQWFIDYIQFITALATITSLHIEIYDFSLDILVQMLQLLPNLDALTLVFSASTGITSLTQDQIELINTTSQMNQITKVNIEQNFLLCHVDILINLCPQMDCLQVQCRTYSDVEFILRVILTRRKPALSSLYFVIPNADQLMVTNLQTLIYLEELIVYDTIQRVGDRIALHWRNNFFLCK